MADVLTMGELVVHVLVMGVLVLVLHCLVVVDFLIEGDVLVGSG